MQPAWRRSNSLPSPYVEAANNSPSGQLSSQDTKDEQYKSGGYNYPPAAPEDQPQSDEYAQRKYQQPHGLGGVSRSRITGITESSRTYHSPILHPSALSPASAPIEPMEPPKPFPQSIPPAAVAEGQDNGDEEMNMSPHQLVEVATAWAQRNGFSQEQLVEFGHMMQMVITSEGPT